MPNRLTNYKGNLLILKTSDSQKIVNYFGDWKLLRWFLKIAYYYLTSAFPWCDCVEYACKISFNGHVQVGFDFSEGVSRTFSVRAERVQICSFLLVSRPPTDTPTRSWHPRCQDIQIDDIRPTNSDTRFVRPVSWDFEVSERTRNSGNPETRPDIQLPDIPSNRRNWRLEKIGDSGTFPFILKYCQPTTYCSTSQQRERYRSRNNDYMMH